MSARALALSALLAASGGCMRVTFTQTRSEYKPHPAAAPRYSSIACSPSKRVTGRRSIVELTADRPAAR
jgi:hypothetical protein